MKVLWFANTPCEAIEYLTQDDVRTIGWMYTLCQQLRMRDEIELHIAFMWGKPLNSFVYNGVVYHPVLRRGMNTRIGRYWNMLTGQFTTIKDKAEIRQCMQIINDVQPDVIHVHGSEDVFGMVAQCKMLRAPVILSIQGLLSVYQQKFYSGLTRNEISRNESIKKKFLLSGFNGNYRNFNRRAKREVEMFKSLQYVIGRTCWDRRCALALNPQIQYFTVNEILRQDFFAAEWENCQPHNCFMLTTTISSGVYKGLEVIYQTAKMLTMSHIPFRWTVIGVSADDEMAKIVERLYKLQAKDVHVNLVGSKSADDMVQIMLQSDLYIQVSHIENSPNSLCEAMALGMPIIASYAGGTSSMMQDEQEGVLLQDGNCYELTGAILEAKQDYQQMVEMGKNARRRALERHNPDKVVNELLTVYETLCSI